MLKLRELLLLLSFNLVDFTARRLSSGSEFSQFVVISVDVDVHDCFHDNCEEARGVVVFEVGQLITSGGVGFSIGRRSESLHCSSDPEELFFVVAAFRFE